MKNAQTAERISALETELAEIRARLAAPVPIPVVAVPRAKGTQDITRAAVLARTNGALDVPLPTRTVAERVRAALRAKPSTLLELVLDVEVSSRAVSNALKEIRPQNIGTDTHPIWTCPIGDETPAGELVEKIAQLTAIRPLTLAEIVAFTGARRNRVSGAIVRLGEARRIENHGAQNAARWYSPPKRG